MPFVKPMVVEVETPYVWTVNGKAAPESVPQERTPVLDALTSQDAAFKFDTTSAEVDAVPVTARFVVVALPCTSKFPVVVAPPEIVRPVIAVPPPIVVDAAKMLPPVNRLLSVRSVDDAKLQVDVE